MKTLSRGDFQSSTLVGICTRTTERLAPEVPSLGLPFQFHTLYGTLRDDANEIYTLTRRITRGDGGPMRLILQTTQGGLPNLKLHAAGRTAARAQNCRRYIADDRLAFESAAATADQPFVIKRGIDDLTWQESNVVTLRGTAIGPDLQWYLPRPNGRFLYVSQFYFVEGEILGRPVRGFICFDDTYKPDEDPAAGKKYPWNPLIDDGVGIAIFNWGNHYVDGSSEVGLFAIGHGGFGVGLYANSAGQVIASSDIDGEVVLSADGRMPLRIDFQLTGAHWEFLPDARGTMPNLASPAQEIDGRMHRVADERIPDVWFSWGQTFPAHGTRKA